jgi:hypothetical protein
VLVAYKANIELVKALAEHYRFDYLFYWQPTLYQKDTLTKFESTVEDLKHKKFFQVTYDIIRRSGLADKSEHHFHDLSLVFADAREPIYIDWNHLGETGNEIIARTMADDVLSVIAANKGTRKRRTAP